MDSITYMYGIRFDYSMTPSAHEQFIKLFKETNPRLHGIKDSIADFEAYKVLRDKLNETSEQPTELELFEDYITELDTDKDIPAEEIIMEIINQRENTKFISCNGYIGCPYGLPWETPACMMSMTEETFTEILNKYFNIFFPYMTVNYTSTLIVG